MFKKATKSSAKLRLAFAGPAGSGKTFSALAVAKHLGERVALIDTEHGSASLYADRFDFDVAELETHHPDAYVASIIAAAQAGYDVLVIDSLSHAWAGKNGCLELVDKATATSKSANSFQSWGKVTPLHTRLIDTIIGAPLHVIATMRTKTEYALERNDRGKTVPRKIGLAPVQRDGVDYEFSVFGELTLEHQLVISKTRCSELSDAVIDKPGKQLADQLLAWLAVPAATPEQVAELEHLGAQTYLGGWAEKRTAIVTAVSKGRAQDVGALQSPEIIQLIDGIKRVAEQNGRQPDASQAEEQEPDAEAVAEDASETDAETAAARDACDALADQLEEQPENFSVTGELPF